jgi:hypothetical protein
MLMLAQRGHAFVPVHSGSWIAHSQLHTSNDPQLGSLMLERTLWMRWKANG